MIGIIIADKHEINKIRWQELERINKNGFEFVLYKLNDKKIVVAHSGIGVVKSAACTQEMISSFNVKEIYNYGAVGSDEKSNLYDLVYPRKIFFHDVITPWYPRGQVPGDVEFYINAIPREKDQKGNNLATGMKFISNNKDVREIQSDLDVGIFDMETAGIAQICYNNNIKLYVIKCISDIIGSDSSKLENINNRIVKAGKKAFEKTIELIEKK
ncbi:MAG: hypothetical protein GY679_05185 [Mycoplasma sp.]|nr:hypothetical protein [Mycoplasma sp.]